MKLKQCECSSSASNMYKGLAFEKVRLLNQYGKDIFVNKIFVPYGTSWERVSVYSALYILDTCSPPQKDKSNIQKIWANFKENIGVEKGDFLKYDVKGRNYEEAD